MKPLHFDAINPYTNKLFTFDDPNLRFVDGVGVYLEHFDPEFTPYPQQIQTNTTPNRKRNYMASNPTPNRYDELVASGEDLDDGLVQHETALDITQNTHAKVRADLDALIAAHTAFKAAEGAQVGAYAALRTADSNAKGFISKAISLLRISLGHEWTDAWAPTGLPDNAVAVPRTQDGRYTALTGLKNYFTANAAKESADLGITAAAATTLHTALTTARSAANTAKANAKAASILLTQKKAAFQKRFRETIEEIDGILSDEAPEWYDFGLNRPADPKTPGVPDGVDATALGGAMALVTLIGARRANSFNYYKQEAGVDPEPVKLGNFPDTQRTFEGLPIGATLTFTVRGVNDAGEGPASEGDTVVIS